MKRFLSWALSISSLIVFSCSAVRANDKCISKITGLSGTISYSNECIPHEIWINPEYGAEYSKLMKTAIDAGANKNDYDSALINFRKAQKISGNKDTEVQRGIMGAIAAKAAVEAAENKPWSNNPGYGSWLLITGQYNDGD